MNKSIPEISKKVISFISRGDLLIDGVENNEDMGPLEIEFSDGSVMTISLVSDGESVEYSISQHKSEKILCQNCEWERVVLSYEQPFSQAVGMRVLGTNTLLFGTNDDEDFVIAGYRLKLENNNILVYYNAGDFAKIYWNDVPPKLPHPFLLKWV